MSLSVTQFGKPLPKEKYTWNKKTKVFSSKEEHLIIQCYVKNTTFNTGSRCTFNAGFDCIFKTGSNCIFNTGRGCTFKTGSNCIFKTGSASTFTTGASCVIIRIDTFELIEIPKETTIKLNNYRIKGFTKINNKN